MNCISDDKDYFSAIDLVRQSELIFKSKVRVVDLSQLKYVYSRKLQDIGIGFFFNLKTYADLIHVRCGLFT